MLEISWRFRGHRQLCQLLPLRAVTEVSAMRKIWGISANYAALPEGSGQAEGVGGAVIDACSRPYRRPRRQTYALTSRYRCAQTPAVSRKSNPWPLEPGQLKIAVFSRPASAMGYRRRVCRHFLVPPARHVRTRFVNNARATPASRRRSLHLRPRTGVYLGNARPYRAASRG